MLENLSPSSGYSEKNLWKLTLDRSVWVESISSEVQPDGQAFAEKLCNLAVGRSGGKTREVEGGPLLQRGMRGVCVDG